MTMTERGKHYWLRIKGSAGQPGSPHGLLAGFNARGKCVWTQKPGIARVFCGGPDLDDYLAKTSGYEAVEVVKRGMRKYHRKWIEKWEIASG